MQKMVKYKTTKNLMPIRDVLRIILGLITYIFQFN